MNLMKRLVPHLEQIHELGAREAEECLLALSVDVPLLPPTFRHLVRHCVASGTFPSLQRAYALYKRQLEFLAAEKGENKRWALKCPAHLPYVSDLLKEFPDARIVWTHRDPRESIPSLCSMFRTFADMSERGPVDLEAIGREQVAFWGAACDRAMHAPRCDVAYADLVRDPVAVVKRVYAACDLTVSPQFERALESHLATRTRSSPHVYSLGEYGLDGDAVRARFLGYSEAMRSRGVVV